MTNPALRVYAENAKTLAAQWESYSLEDAFAPVADLLPAAPRRVADIGAGPGRVAAWLAGQGHDVVAVEPVQEFRNMALAKGTDAGVEWLDDGLPELNMLKARPAFDLLLLSGVWHHVSPDVREVAMAAMAACLRPTGQIIMNLRHGQDDPSRGLYKTDPDQAIAVAERAGLQVAAIRKSASIQPHNCNAGISWTWLVLCR